MNNLKSIINLYNQCKIINESSMSAKKAAGTKRNKHEQEIRRKTETAKDRLEAFKKKYNFKPTSSKYGENTGTITWRGETIPVKFTSDAVTTCTSITGVVTYAPNQMLCDLSNGEINIDERLFKLKKQKSRDIILDHEVGHSKLHRWETKDGKINTQMIDACVDEAIMNFGVSQRTLAKGIRQLMKKKLTEKYDEAESNKANFDKMRQDCIKIFKKYEDKNIAHSSYREYEADSYALNKNNATPKQLGDAIGKYTKIVTPKNQKFIDNETDNKILNKVIDNANKSLNKKVAKIQDKDIKNRVNVQNKKVVQETRKNKIYNESVLNLDYFE